MARSDTAMRWRSWTSSTTTATAAAARRPTRPRRPHPELTFGNVGGTAARPASFVRFGPTAGAAFGTWSTRASWDMADPGGRPWPAAGGPLVWGGRPLSKVGALIDESGRCRALPAPSAEPPEGPRSVRSTFRQGRSFTAGVDGWSSPDHLFATPSK